MNVYTDNLEFAGKILPHISSWKKTGLSNLEADIRPLSEKIYGTDRIFSSCVSREEAWTALFIVRTAPGSQYDLLVGILQDKIKMPDRILCLADVGINFHGHKGRPWATSEGNIHLVVHLAPKQVIEHYPVGFTILSAVSVFQAIDSLDGFKGRAGVKWVNDILIEGAKVCGVLAHTQAEGNKVTGAVLGIGLNVDSVPPILPTPFVPEVTSLSKIAPAPASVSRSRIFDRLISLLHSNYRLLLEGGYENLLNIYRERSLIIGRNVEITPDPPASGTDEENIIEGRVTGIGDNLELYLEGRKKPVARGRLILKD
jgi:BirA family biotin operon repressor/biotin-[acetyl-CoA-carboxylase] ligase